MEKRGNLAAIETPWGWTEKAGHGGRAPLRKGEKTSQPHIREKKGGGKRRKRRNGAGITSCIKSK